MIKAKGQTPQSHYTAPVHIVFRYILSLVREVRPFNIERSSFTCVLSICFASVICANPANWKYYCITSRLYAEI